MSDPPLKGFRILNTGTLIDSECYPYIAECKFLDTLLDLVNDYSDDEIPLRLPCQCDSTVYILLAYLRTGLLPRLITEPSYTDVLTCLKYLHSPAIDQVTLDDRLLNTFHLEDRHINSNLDLYSMYDSEGQLYPVESIPMKYPILAEVTKFPVFPQTKAKALYRLLDCSMDRCKRRQFITNVMSQCPALVLAGGSLQFARVRRFSRCSCSTDLDFFLLTVPEFPVARILTVIGKEYSNCFGSYFSLQTANTVSFFRLTPIHRNTVQLVLKHYAGIPQVLASFDLDSCCFAYYQGDIWYNDRAKRVLACGYNIVDVRRRSSSFEYRLLKYHHKYGIGIAIPGFIYCRLERAHPPFVGLSRLLHGLNSTSRISEYELSGQIAQSQCPYTLLNNLRSLVGSSAINSIALKFNSPVFNVPVIGSDHPLSKVSSPDRPITDGWFFQAYGGDQLGDRVPGGNSTKASSPSVTGREYRPGRTSTHSEAGDWSIDIGGFQISSSTTSLQLAYYLEQVYTRP
jgi:hypothetical protein